MRLSMCITALATLSLIGCTAPTDESELAGRSAGTPAATTTAAAPTPMPAAEPVEAPAELPAPAEASIVLSQAPGGAMSIGELRASGAGPGDAVVIRAQIGGRNPPWIPGAGIMMLADTQKLAACGPGGCGAPWDFCHVPPDQLQANTVVVRWLDAQGQPRRQGFEQLMPIAPLATVVVRGTLADIPGSPAVVIDCDGIHLEDPGPFGS